MRNRALSLLIEASCIQRVRTRCHVSNLIELHVTTHNVPLCVHVRERELRESPWQRPETPDAPPKWMKQGK